ncbi:hypothetical protein AB0I28_34610 [Phytomonospora sp. NPDC050363]|uniref:hypothetical protein n=1 Tax=Phytomonospora sp. NPDC050363 TaxID=3155642 RepID=UPI0033CF1C02
MRKLFARVSRALLPKNEAKASVVIARCVSGCGGDGVYFPGTIGEGKPPCC